MKKFCFHKWSKWGKVQDTDTHFYKAQFRHCKKCGKSSSRMFAIRTGTTTSIPAGKINENGGYLEAAND